MIECIGIERAAPFEVSLVFRMIRVGNRAQKFRIAVRATAVLGWAGSSSRNATRVTDGRICGYDRFEGDAMLQPSPKS